MLSKRIHFRNRIFWCWLWLCDCSLLLRRLFIFLFLLCPAACSNRNQNQNKYTFSHKTYGFTFWLINPFSFAIFTKSSNASSREFFISPSRIASLICSLMSPIILLAGRLYIFIISSPVTGG